MKNVGYCVHESKVVDTFTMTRWYGCRKRGGRCEKRGCKDFEREAVRRAGDGDLIRRLTICAGFHRQCWASRDRANSKAERGLAAGETAT